MLRRSSRMVAGAQSQANATFGDAAEFASPCGEQPVLWANAIWPHRDCSAGQQGSRKRVVGYGRIAGGEWTSDDRDQRRHHLGCKHDRGHAAATGRAARVRSDDGEALYFHCVNIADGSRRVALGEAVSARRGVGHRGHDEARAIVKLSQP